MDATRPTLESAREPAANPVGSLADSRVGLIESARAALLRTDWSYEYADGLTAWAAGKASVAAAYASLTGLPQDVVDALWRDCRCPDDAPRVTPAPAPVSQPQRDFRPRRTRAQCHRDIAASLRAHGSSVPGVDAIASAEWHEAQAAKLTAADGGKGA